MTDLWRRDPDGTLYAEITKDELDKTVERMQRMADRIERLEAALREIRDVALCSEGVEFYAMLADKALNGEG